jgi:hypothetical protein
MQKRNFIFGAYNTARHGWTLTGWALSDPEQKTNYVEKPGGDGSWDLSTVMTEDIPRYKDRSLTVTLECSKGTRADRETLINEMVNQLDGLKWQIVTPDRREHYLVGRLHVAVNYNDLAHAAVTVTGTCEPWLYSAAETVVEIKPQKDVYDLYTVTNKGRRVTIPKLTVTDGFVLVNYNGSSLTMMSEAGVFVDETLVTTSSTYEWPALLLTPGEHELSCVGDGKSTLTITYREAVLR